MHSCLLGQRLVWNNFKLASVLNTAMLKYCKIMVVSPGLIFVQIAVLLGLFSGQGLVIGRNFAFQNGLSLTIEQLALTVHGLIFGRAYYRKDFCV